MILDTNAISAAVKKDPSLFRALTGGARPSIPVPVIGEYRYGLLKSSQRALLTATFESLLQHSTILATTLETAEHYAVIRYELQRAGKPIPANDLWIAALARQHGLPVASLDGHFDHVPGLSRVAW